jgi:uncharacterized Tic20 family protein
MAATPHRRLRRGGAMNASDSPSSAPQDGPQAQRTEERTWAMIAHLSALAFFVLPPVGGVIGPLVVWLAKKDSSAFVSEAAREAINFNLAVLAAYAVCVLLMFIFIGILLGAALLVFWLVMTLVAAIRASEGIHYKYPITVRVVK